jgi:hypothetical protein
MRTVERIALRHRIALAVVATLVVVLLALLPVAISSAAVHFIGLPFSQVYPLLAPQGPPAASYSRLHVEMIALDSWMQLLTLRVSGTHVCPPGCDWQGQVVFFSLHADDVDAEGLPPSAAVALPPSTGQVTQTIQLPVSGLPIRYPFDSYDLGLGIVLQRVAADGTVQTLTPAEADGRLFVTLRSRLSLLTLGGPPRFMPRSIRGESASNYLSEYQFTLHRPVWLPLLTIMLVLLIATAAGYAVFMQRLHDLAVGAGGLILGVWGIRTIILPSGVTYTTAVELALAVVLLFLLGGVSIRVLLSLWERNQLPLPGRGRARSVPSKPGPPTTPNGTTAPGVPRLRRGEHSRRR